MTTKERFELVGYRHDSIIRLLNEAISSALEGQSGEEMAYKLTLIAGHISNNKTTIEDIRKTLKE